MEVIAIGLICAAAFGAVVAVSAFIRHLLLSRDKRLNDEAQERALSHEADELKKIRDEMQSRKRMTAHYQLLTENKHAIQHLDDKIDQLTHKKAELITRWADITLRESKNMITDGCDPDRKEQCDRLKEEIDISLAAYDGEIEKLQQRRDALLIEHQDIAKYMLEQDKAQSDNLDALFEKHSSMLEKMFLRHNENSEHVATKSIEAGTSTFSLILQAPIEFLKSMFGAGTGINLGALQDEITSRGNVADAEDTINQPGNDWEDDNPDSDDDYDQPWEAEYRLRETAAN